MTWHVPILFLSKTGWWGKHTKKKGVHRTTFTTVSNNNNNNNNDNDENDRDIPWCNLLQ